LFFVLCTILCWGAYVPTIHAGQVGFGTKPAALRAFICVGVAYFLISVAVFAYLLLGKPEPLDTTNRGLTLSTLAGVLGALGALGIVFAMMYGGKPIFVAPVVFAGAPIVNTIVSMIWHKPANPPNPLFFVGIILAAIGAAMVLRFKPV
jgi:hypothetical protein